MYSPLAVVLIRRFSSAVEQRFCKPKVGSSILSTGTTLNEISILGGGHVDRFNPLPRTDFNIKH